MSFYRVEGARHVDDSTVVQLWRRGKKRRALGIMNPLWEHVYIIKGADSKRHNHIHWVDVMNKWKKAAKPKDPAQTIREAVKHMRGRPILFVKLPAP